MKETILSLLRGKYEQAYGFAVFDLDIIEKDSYLKVSGKVLTENQKAQAMEELVRAYGKNIKDDIRVLSDIKTEELGWAIVKAKFADLRSRFVESRLLNDKICVRTRASQAARGEILRIVFKKEDQLLVQTSDLTLGWIRRKEVTVKRESMRKEWQKGIFAQSGRLILLSGSRGDLITEAENFLGVKYVLGGRSEEGIDCSALTQLAYKNAFDIILPRHSWNQKNVGEEVKIGEALSGDLIFMLNRQLGSKHVGILKISGEEKEIIHASSIERKVVRQDIEEVFKYYEPVEARRIIKK